MSSVTVHHQYKLLSYKNTDMYEDYFPLFTMSPFVKGQPSTALPASRTASGCENHISYLFLSRYRYRPFTSTTSGYITLGVMFPTSMFAIHNLVSLCTAEHGDSL